MRTTPRHLRTTSRNQRLRLAAGYACPHLRHGEARYVDGEESNETQLTADPAPVPGHLARGLEFVHLQRIRTRPDRARDPDAVLVVTHRDIRDRRPGVVVVLRCRGRSHVQRRMPRTHGDLTHRHPRAVVALHLTRAVVRVGVLVRRLHTHALLPY